MLRLGRQEPIRPSGNDCAIRALNLQYRRYRHPKPSARFTRLRSRNGGLSSKRPTSKRSDGPLKTETMGLSGLVQFLVGFKERRDPEIKITAIKTGTARIKSAQRTGREGRGAIGRKVDITPSSSGTTRFNSNVGWPRLLRNPTPAGRMKLRWPPAVSGHFRRVSTCRQKE